MASIQIFKQAPVSVALEAAKSGDLASVSALTLKSGAVDAKLTLASAIEIPADLLFDDETAREVLPTVKEAAALGMAAARARLREALANAAIDEAAFFAFPNGFAEASVSVRVPDGEGDAIPFRLDARARLDVQADFDLAGYAVFNPAAAVFEARVTVASKDVVASLELLVPDVPNLGFNLNNLALPGLSFSGLDGTEVGLESLTALKLPLPEWLPDISIEGGGPIAVTVDAESESFNLKAGSDVVLKFRDYPIAKVEDFKATLIGGDIKVEGKVTAALDVDIDERFEFGGGDLPVRAEVELKEVKSEIASGNLTLQWMFPEIAVEATDDSGSRIAVGLKLQTVTEINSGATSWAVTDAELLDLGADVDFEIPELDVVDGLVNLRLGFLAEAGNALAGVVDRLTRLLAAVVRHMSKAVGAVTGLLSEVAKALADLLAEALRKLMAVLDRAGDIVSLELRLDAATLRPLQIVVLPVRQAREAFTLGGKLLRVKVEADYRPGLVLDFVHNWQGLTLLRPANSGTTPSMTVSTDLWLGSQSGESVQIPAVSEAPLLSVKVTPKKANAAEAVVVAGLQNGRGVFFKTFGIARVAQTDIVGAKVVTVREISDLSSLSVDNFDFKLDAERLKQAVTALMPQGPEQSGDVGPDNPLAQYVEIENFEVRPAAGSPPEIGGVLKLRVKIGDIEVPFEMTATLNLETLELKIAADDTVIVESTPIDQTLFGFDLLLVPEEYNPDNPKPEPLFEIGVGNGDLSLSLLKGAKATLSSDQFSGDGGALTLKVDEFAIDRAGLDLTATVEPDKPVRLGGLDQPFRFTSGSIAIKDGELLGGTISGYGPLPPALVGEAKAEIDLVFGQRNGALTLVAANAKLEKEGEPLYSTGTRFRVVLDALGLGFVTPVVGPTQFYFQLWGSASFEPEIGAFDGGLLENIKSVAIRLEGAPLTGNGRELLKHISFLVELDPPLRENLFEIFKFEIRGIAFYPASHAWPDNPPAMGIAGQISFLEAGDVVSSEIKFHEILIALPEPGGDIPLPRIRADGLSMLLRIGGVAQIEATALAVDGSIPSLYAPVKLPADVTAKGFLASGRIDIVGLGAFGGALGVLELEKENRVKHAMFVYGQAEKLTERIDTPIGPLFIREVGFGFGKNYTLSALAGADQAKTPRELVKTLDRLSKIQGNLMNFNAWTPQFEKDALTLALRGMISTAAKSTSSASYDADGEAKVSNPLLMDIVLALRTDLTFFINVRGWIATNYHDWFVAPSGAEFKERPTLRGYLYFSVPRKEFLARFLSDPEGIVGKHPELPKELVQAIEGTRFAATLYIRPGLYHTELGWPYELGFELGKPTDNFYLSLSAGMVFRIEDATMLYGIAFKAEGLMQFGGEVGNANFGASATARAEFLLGARFIAYLAPLNPKDTLFYGEVYLGLTLEFSVAIWLSFKVFRKRFTLRIGFSIGLTIEIAAEVVLSGQGLGARVFATVGVQGFGRSLSVGVGFSFGDGALERARSRVARFMELGLGIDPPREETLLAPAPAAEPARRDRAVKADDRLDDPPPPQPPTEPLSDPVDVKPVPGNPITGTDFWAVLFLAGTDADGDESYIVQLIPRDHSRMANSEEVEVSDKSTFYAEPFYIPSQDAGAPTSGATKDRDDPDYRITLEADIGGIKYCGRESEGAAGELIELSQGNPKTVFANLSQPVGETENGALDLNFLLTECFLAHPDIKTQLKNKGFGEPFPIDHARPVASDDVAPRDQRARQAKRFAKTTKELEASVVAEEKRSALINKIGETAFVMAERARQRPGQVEDVLEDVLKEEQRELNAVDFGLTFLMKATALDLFADNGKAKLKLEKRVGNYPAEGAPTWEWEECAVQLLNHPDKSFDAIEPRLEDARVEVTDDGYRLYWDLEPAFGSSAEIGFAEDPETQLAYYDIERSFEGADIAMTARFRTKSATPQTYEFKDNVVTVTRSRATLHLTDDLRQGGVPAELRSLLFGTPLPEGVSARDVWKAAFGNASRGSVVYKVTAVDVMGTRTGLRVLEHEFERPPLDVRPPLSVEIAVSYDGDLPALNEDARPDVELTLVYANETHLGDTEKQPLQLRIRSYELLGGGEYGADAVDEAKTRPGQADIDRKRDGPDVDLYIVPDENGALTVNRAYPEVVAPEDQPAPARYSVLPVPRGEPEKDPLGALRDALRIPNAGGKSRDLRACRAFLRAYSELQLPGDAGDPYAEPTGWIYVNNLLRATRVVEKSEIVADDDGKREFAAVVETLETPLKLPFLALRQTQIDRNAGRLELVYPDEDKTLEDLALTEEKVTRRRLDPERRAAIRLEFNASGARMTDLEETDLAPLVAGYDVFAVDPARLRAVAGSTGATVQQVVAEARKRTGVKVLPRTLAGTSPSALPDTRSIEVRYPSDTARTDPGALQGRQRAPWYSPAESLVDFPLRTLRRSLFPAPEEAMISEILSERKVTKVWFTVSPQAGPDDAKKVKTWLDGSDISVGKDLAHPEKGQDLDADDMVTSDKDIGLQASELRAILRGLVIKPSADWERRYQGWRNEGSPPDRAGLFRVRVTIKTIDALDKAVDIGREVDLTSSLHPVLADTLDALNFEPYDKDTAGAVYRKYEVVREPVPPLEAEGFETFLDARSPSADPYGWGVLRAMGLAEGLRVYDIDDAAYLKGAPLFEHVYKVFSSALERYTTYKPMGHPFVELVDVPEDFMGISSFDGRAAAPEEDTRRIRGGDTSILQLGLRPHADRQAEEKLPVRYLVCRRAPDAELSPDDEPQTLEFPTAFGPALIDTIGLPLEQGAGTGRFAVGGAGGIVFPEGGGDIPGVALVQYGRLTRLAEGQPAVLIRVAAVEDGFAFSDFRNQLQDRIGAEHLVVSDWIDTLEDWKDSVKPEATDGNPFDVFAPLDTPLLRVLLDRKLEEVDASAVIQTPATRFFAWLPPRHHPQNDAAFDAAAFAGRFGEWSERFLRHGAALRGRKPDYRAIGFAFAALTTGESYARTPDQNGRVSVFMIDESRLGRERYFAILPYGRYVSIENAARGKVEEPTLKDALLGDWREQFAAVSLPRSKPLDPPAILSATLAERDLVRGTEGVELVVARTADQIVSTANLRAERALQGAWTGLELRASYPAADIAASLPGIEKFEPFEGFADEDFGKATGQAGAMENTTGKDLVPLARRAPDAWRGAIRYEILGAPPFFDLVAMVHQSAGVAVSEVSAVKLPAPGTVLRLPPLEPDVDKVRHIEPAKPPTWQFDYVEKHGETHGRVAFDVPAVRNIDLMPDVDITAWTGNEEDRATLVYRLPDAQASYRISTLSPDLASAAPLVEVLPARKVADEDRLYHPMLVSKVFEAVVDTVTIAPQDAQTLFNWRLGVTADLPAGTLPEPAELPEPPGAFEAGFGMKPDEFALWLVWAPTRKVSFKVENLDGVEALMVTLAEYVDVPGVQTLIEALNDAAQEDTLSATLPLGLPPDLSGVTDSEVTQEDWDYPAGLENGLPVSVVRRSRFWSEWLPDTSAAYARQILTIFSDRRRRDTATGKAGLGAVYWNTDVADPIEELRLPYAHFQTLRYARDDGNPIEETVLWGLIDAVEEAETNDPHVKNLALNMLEQVKAGPKAVLIVWPVADEKVPAADLTSEIVEGSQRGGVHWLPDATEQMKVPELLRDAVLDAIRDTVFGEDVQLRLSAYRGNAAPDTLLIDPILATEVEE